MNDTPTPAPDAKARAEGATPWGLLILLMATTSIGPTSLNILVPAVPQLTRTLGSDIATLQLTVSLFLVGLAVAQLVMGPLSDRFGRRPVMLGGLALTVVASLGAIVMSTVESLIVARVLQAVGASAGIVVSRAMIRDLFDRSRAASVLGLVATVMVAAPTFGPLIGGVLDTAFGWETIFIFTAVTTFAVLVWAAFILPETRGRNARGEQAGFWGDLRQLAASARFAGYVLAASIGSATFFVFLGAGPHVIVNLMGRTSAEYGVWFAISSIGFMTGNFAASRLSLRYRLDALIGWGIVFEAVGVVAATVLAATALSWGPASLFMPQMIISFGNGLMLPGSIAGAVSIRPQAAGTASGIIGCAQMAMGAVIIQLSGTLFADAASAVPMTILMDVLVVALAASFLLLVGRR